MHHWAQVCSFCWPVWLRLKWHFLETWGWRQHFHPQTLGDHRPWEATKATSRPPVTKKKKQTKNTLLLSHPCRFRCQRMFAWGAGLVCIRRHMTASNPCQHSACWWDSGTTPLCAGCLLNCPRNKNFSWSGRGVSPFRENHLLASGNPNKPDTLSRKPLKLILCQAFNLTFLLSDIFHLKWKLGQIFIVIVFLKWRGWASIKSVFKSDIDLIQSKRYAKVYSANWQ